MADKDSGTLDVARREVSNSRQTRRLRREGFVPGVVYGGGDDPLAFSVEERALRLALAHAGAVIDLSIDGAKAMPVVVKDQQRHPVKGHIMHLDLLRVRLDRAIQATVSLELTGTEDAPGTKEGGVLEHVTREIVIEALPNDIPDSIVHDVSAMEINDTVTLAAVTVPSGVTLVADDPEEIVVATLTPPRLEVEEEIEEETALVGEDGEPIEAAEAEGEGATAEEAEGGGDSEGE
jgi:large subunit ribosomal protein L25